MRHLLFIGVMVLLLSCGQNNNNQNNQAVEKKELVKRSEISIDKFLGKWKNNGKSAGEVFTGSTVTITKEAENIIVKLNSSGEILQNTGEFTNGKIKVSLSFAGQTDISYSEENGQPFIYVFGAKMDKIASINIAHTDFTIFWEDFKKAINSGDKDAITQMTNIPFKDKYREDLSMVEGIGKSRTSKTAEQFKLNYSNLFTSDIVTQINSNSYIGWEKRDELGVDGSLFKKGDFVLLAGEQGLFFTKVDGVYKLISIKYYSMTVDAD